MSKEQWLVYLYGVYPDGGITTIYIILLSVYLIISLILIMNKSLDGDKVTFEDILKLKLVIPITLSVLIFLSNLVPSKQTFLYLVATPYAVESGKTLIESLDDPTSKLYKLNKLLDKGLDKAIKELGEKDEQ